MFSHIAILLTRIEYSALLGFGSFHCLGEWRSVSIHLQQQEFDMAFIKGTLNNDILSGTEKGDNIFGLGGRDLIFGLGGADFIHGGDHGDNISGGDGNDWISAGKGDDSVDGGAGNDQIFGGAGDDFVNGGEGDDLVSGGNGNDYVEGAEGNDTLFGGAGDDTMIGDQGADIQTGGAGNDQFSFFLSTLQGDSLFSAPDRIVDFTGAGTAGGDTISLRDRVVFDGKVAINPVLGIELPGGGNGLKDMFYTTNRGTTWLIADTNDDGRLDSQDTAIAFTGVQNFTEGDFVSTTFVTAGTSFADVLVGTASDDVIYGLGGNDRINGGLGNDELDGGAGNDNLNGGGGFDTLYGGTGNDVLSLRISDLGGNVEGGAGDDVLIGSDTTFSLNTLNGNEGNDILRAGAGGASMLGEDGNDRLVGSAGDDQFVGGQGVDTFVFGAIWTNASSGFTDVIYDFEDGVEKIDLRDSGLTFADLLITDDGFSAIITATAGRIEVAGLAGQIAINDFLF